MDNPSAPMNVMVVAGQLAERLESRGQEYAFGGAIALGFWGVPRGTVDVDLTLYLPQDRLSDCTQFLMDLGCQLTPSADVESLQEHGFCSVEYCAVRLDVFVPTIPFYEATGARRKRVEVAGRSNMVRDAETLAVFKMMFFRRKDLADVEQILRTQGGQFDRGGVHQQLAAVYGTRDPRPTAWGRIAREAPV